MKRFVTLATLAALLIVPAASARGGNSAPSVVANPSSATVGQVVDISGCGYPGNKQLSISVSGPNGYISSLPAPDGLIFSDTNGCFDVSWTAGPDAGSYSVLVTMRSGAKQARASIAVS